ncbi:zinc finger protein 235-like [Anopheles bellator]|uniref:zinc finger protein 235-like n=1 Tax=Anopheles bellator TaxID=139047 RepID=UPI00264947FA|nr:zinc finger protein 235-like [Anopheles bellator]
MEFSITSDSCRVCLRKAGVECKLLTEALHTERRVTLREVFQMCTGFDQEPERLTTVAATFYPRKICNSCELLLLAAYDFRKKSNKSEKVLQNILHFYDDEDGSSVVEELEEVRGWPTSRVEGACEKHEDNEEIIEERDSMVTVDDTGLELLQEAALLLTEESGTTPGVIMKEGETAKAMVCADGTNLKDLTEQTCNVTDHPAANGHENSVDELVIEDVMADLVDYVDEEDDDEYDEGVDQCEEANIEILLELKAQNLAQCPDCGKIVSQHFLLKHRETHLDESERERPFECDICRKQFTLRENMHKHKRIHQNDRRYECPLCKERFLHWAARRYHIARVHTKEKRFACEYCGAKFRQSSHYTVHLRRHTGSRPHGCELCTRAFPTTYALKLHMLSHSDKKEFSCDICDKPYKTAKSLQVHRKTHTNRKDYVCGVCSKTFTQNHAMRTHHRKAHPTHPLPRSGTIVNVKALERMRKEMRPDEGEARQEDIGNDL